MRGGTTPLAGRRILVPAARLGPNLLARRLDRLGARAVSFPELTVQPPSDPSELERALGEIDGFDAVVVAGRTAMDAVLRGLGTGPAGRIRFVAVGAGAVARLREAGLSAATAPGLHTPEGIADEVPAGAGGSVLIAHEERVPPVLAEELRSRGLEVTEVAAFRVEPSVDRNVLAAALRPFADMIALANPSAVRIVARTAEVASLHLETCLAGVPVAAVGSETARESRRLGLAPDLVAGGRLDDLVADISSLLA